MTGVPLDVDVLKIAIVTRTLAATMKTAHVPIGCVRQDGKLIHVATVTSYNCFVSNFNAKIYKNKVYCLFFKEDYKLIIENDKDICER